MNEESMNRRREFGEFGTPVTELWENILMIPISGVLDSNRGKEIMESVCNKVFEKNNKSIIIDILGVPVVDSQVAQQLINIASAVKIMGSEAIITGVSPVVAQSLVNLQVDLTWITTKSSLKDGIYYAFSKNGLEVVEKDAE